MFMDHLIDWWGNWGQERSRNFPKGSQVTNSRAMTLVWPRPFDPRSSIVVVSTIAQYSESPKPELQSNSDDPNNKIEVLNHKKGF